MHTCKQRIHSFRNCYRFWYVNVFSNGTTICAVS